MKSIKVVGAAGTGKSTLIAEIKKIKNEIKSISYGDLLQKINGLPRAQLHLSQPKDHQTADLLFKEFLNKPQHKNSLILIDDHLEIKTERDLYRIYQRENTIGIIFLKSSPSKILNRIQADKTKHRQVQTLKKIEQDQRTTKQMATELAERLVIPLLILEDHLLEQNTHLTLDFIQLITGG